MIYREALGVAPDEWTALWMTAIAMHESAWGRSVVPSDERGLSYNCIGYHFTNGYGWDRILSREAGTGRTQAYRRFESWKHCMKALLYLIQKSKIDAYRRSRLQPAREMRVKVFSQGYCPVDPRHGDAVLAAMRELKPIVEEAANGESATV
jgi:hypothetical protein